MSDDGLTSDFLLRAILSWYASPLNWASQTTYSPYSAAASTAAARDHGASAARAVAAKGIGDLILVALDVSGGHINELARRADMTVTRLSEIVRNLPMTPEESQLLRIGVQSFFTSR